MIDHKQIIDHYVHACSKHPHFCDGLLFSDNIGDYVRLNKVSHDACEINPCAESALNEEVAEVLLALAEGDKEHAIEECYDTIAVLLRIIDEVRK